MREFIDDNPVAWFFLMIIVAIITPLVWFYVAYLAYKMVREWDTDIPMIPILGVVGVGMLLLIMVVGVLATSDDGISSTDPEVVTSDEVVQDSIISEPVIETPVESGYSEEDYQSYAQKTAELIDAGFDMDRLRGSDDYSVMRRCGERMRELQNRAQTLRAQTKSFTPSSPIEFPMSVAIQRLEMCVSCSPSALLQCELAREELEEAVVYLE